MTSEIFAAVVISGTAGAVFGVILKHVLDTRHINEIKDAYEDIIDSWRRLYNNHINDWRNMVKRYQQRVIELEAEKAERLKAQAEFDNMIKTPVMIKPEAEPEWLKHFYDLDTLPAGEIDLDFPNSKEGK